MAACIALLRKDSDSEYGVDFPDFPAAPAVRVNVTLPQDLLDAIDRVSGNRSRFPADAAREKLRA